MKELNQNIRDQYNRPKIFEDILERLKDRGIDLHKVSRTDIAAVDEFHVRGAAVSKELAKVIDLNGAKLLDVGCGLGGPCRMLADEFNCTAIGVDISEEFIRTANGLSALVALRDRTEFVHGDACSLPFKDESFDVVWTQHVQMNIEDKIRFYSEIKRVLKQGGHFMFYDIFKNGNKDIAYPVPWANSPHISFLFRPEDMESILENLKFDKIQSKDQTDAGITYFERMVARSEDIGPPKLGLNVLMGESSGLKIMNLLNALKTGGIILQSGVFRNR